MLVVQPSGGSASQPILGLGRTACGTAGLAARGRGSPVRFGGNSRHLPWLCFFACARWRRERRRPALPGWDRLPAGIPVPARQPRRRKPEDRPVFRGPLVGQNATRRRTALPLHLREGDEACTTLLSCARSARGIPPLLPSVIPALRSPDSGSPEPRRPIVPTISWRAASSPARACREPPIGQGARPSG